MATSTEQRDRMRLAKVLAYAGSDHDGEALAALRAARKLVREQGGDLERLIAGLRAEGAIERPPPKTSDAADRILWQRQIDDLRREFRLVKKEATRNLHTVQELTRQIKVLQAALKMQKRETEGWRIRAWRNLWKGRRTL